MLILRWLDKSLPGRAHRANVVHQLLVLHETATTEMTGARVPLNGRLMWGNLFKICHQQVIVELQGDFFQWYPQKCCKT